MDFLFEGFLGLVCIWGHFLLLTDHDVVDISDTLIFANLLIHNRIHHVFGAIGTICCRRWHNSLRLFCIHKNFVNVGHARFRVLFAPLRLISVLPIEVGLSGRQLIQRNIAIILIFASCILRDVFNRNAVTQWSLLNL